MFDLSTNIIGEVSGWNGGTLTLSMMNKTGDFLDGDLIRGVDSNALYTLGSFTTLDNPNSDYDQNKQLETGGDDILDWGETCLLYTSDAADE